MANQIIVTNTGVVQVVIEPTPNIQVQISRAVIGTVSNVPTANFANFAGNVTNSAQPNITSLGTLSNLSVSGNTTLNNLVVIGNLSVGNLIANSANFANFAGVANTANSVAGANVTGIVANATFANSAGTSNSATFANTANSVTLANVSGAGNIASINLDGNVANLLTGLGTFVAIPSVTANANFANFAGTAFNVTGSNVTGEVANSAFANIAGLANAVAGANVSGAVSFATTANSVAGANVSGEVANASFANLSNTANSATISNSANSVTLANVSGAGNIASINLDGNLSNILFGNGVFAAVPNISNVANANFANFAGTAFSVSGSNVSGEVANAAYANAANTANLATFATTANAVSGSNVSGTVANATFALDAGNSNLANTANSVALANVVGIGNIANINLDGNISNILFGNGTFSAIPVVSNVANANFANFAGTAFSVAGSNVSGEVANANYSSYANIAASANSVAVGNVVGIGNIATINLDGNVSNLLTGFGTFVAIPTTLANANFANFAGNALVLANGTSNITIPTASSNILISTNGNANIVDIRAEGSLGIRPPAQGPLNALRIETYGRSGNTGAQRISSFRFRGNSTTPLGVQPSDTTMEILTAGSNGTALQTNSLAFIRGQVDSSYTANTANIPLGWQIIVNDTNGGVNNQGKTHNFYANGSTVLSGNLQAIGGDFAVNKTTANATTLNLRGDKTTNSAFSLFDTQFSVNMNNVDTTTGFSPFRFQQYAPTNNNFGSMFMYRARGNSFANATPVVANDQIMSFNFIVNSDNTTTSVGAFNSTVTYNDNAGNVGSKLDLIAIGAGTTGYLNGSINLDANTTNANNLVANNVAINSNGFVKLANYTEAAIGAITGQLGWIAAISDSSGGGNPNGMICFWDTTNNRWSYIHDNSAV